MTKTICIYHANCADGMTAAWVVFQALGSAVRYIPASYDDDGLPDGLEGANVILVDFSYKRPVMLDLARQARTVLVLDHHKTAKEELAGFDQPNTSSCHDSNWITHIDASPQAIGAVRCIFDMERSGAQLAWDFFYPDAPRPPLVEYTADRDLWKHKLPDSAAVTAWIASHDMEMGEWHTIHNIMLDDRLMKRAIEKGRAILAARDKMTRDAVRSTRRDMVIGGRIVPVANVPYFFASDGGHLLAGDAKIGATYVDLPTGVRKFSLRGDGSIDVAEIAASYGGGGHHDAAGFTMPNGWEGDCPVPEFLEEAGW